MAEYFLEPITREFYAQGTIVQLKAYGKKAEEACAFVMGLEEGLMLAESIKGVDAIFITENKRI